MLVIDILITVGITNISIDIKVFWINLSASVVKTIAGTRRRTINSNISSILDSISNEEILNQITKIMSDDYDITDNNKAIMDIIKIYEKNKLVNEKNEIINKLEDSKNLTQEEVASLENKLSELIIKLAKMK